MASSTTPQADVGEEEFEQKCSLLETNSEDANSMVMVMYDRHDETKRSPRAMLPGPRCNMAHFSTVTCTVPTCGKVVGHLTILNGAITGHHRNCHSVAEGAALNEQLRGLGEELRRQREELRQERATGRLLQERVRQLEQEKFDQQNINGTS